MEAFGIICKSGKQLKWKVDFFLKRNNILAIQMISGDSKVSLTGTYCFDSMSLFCDYITLQKWQKLWGPSVVRVLGDS